MKKILIILSLLISTTTIFAQQEWGDVKKNTLTMTEIGPIWPGCENGSASVRSRCFNQRLSKHIATNFKYPASAYKNNEQGKVIVEFMITAEGLVDVKKVSGGTSALQAEAKRNIMAMPKMAKPGMLGGKPRAIKFIVPFNFKTGK